MATPRGCGAFTDELYSALADALLLGEPVPASMVPLWEHAGQCPECLARLEDHRLVSQRLSSALRAAETDRPSVPGEPPVAPEAACASIVLALSLVAGTWQVRLRQRRGWIGPERSITARPATRSGGAAGSMIEFDEFAVEVLPRGEFVEVTVYSAELPVDRLVVQALDSEGGQLDRKTTGARGSVELAAPSATSYDLVVEWPEGGGSK